MKDFIIIFLMSAALCGCSADQHARDIPADTPRVVFKDLRREKDPSFTTHEQAIIAAARRHLEETDHRSVDAYYRIKHTADGYEVFVLFVGGYDGTRPLFKPGGHCTVLLREDGTITRVLGGA